MKKQFLCGILLLITVTLFSQTTIDSNLNRSKDQLYSLKKSCIEVNFDLLIKNEHVDSNYTVIFQKWKSDDSYTLEIPKRAKGKFSTYLNYNEIYYISFSCNGYITKIMEINTYNAPKMDWQANITIIMPKGKREPIYTGGIAYNPYKGEFVKTRHYLNKE